MKRTSTAALYLLLAAVAAISMTYYIAGAIALRQEFFHAAQYTREPFNISNDGLTLQSPEPEAAHAGVKDGDHLLSVNGVPFSGYAQLHELMRHLRPGQPVVVTVRHASGAVQQTTIRTAARQGPDFGLGHLVAILAPVLGVPLLSLITGYWVVVARPRDFNAWLVLILLALPETFYGNLDWSFWPAPWYLILGLWNAVVQILAFPALLWFGFLFPERWRLDRRLPWFKIAILAAMACLFVAELWSLYAQFFRSRLLLCWARCNTGPIAPSPSSKSSASFSFWRLSSINSAPPPPPMLAAGSVS